MGPVVGTEGDGGAEELGATDVDGVVGAGEWVGCGVVDPLHAVNAAVIATIDAHHHIRTHEYWHENRSCARCPQAG